MKFGSGVKVTRPEAATVSTPSFTLLASLTTTDVAAQSGGGWFAAHKKIPLGT